MQRCKTLHAKRCKVTNKLRDVRRTLSHMYGRLYGTTEGRNVVLNPVPSQHQLSIGLDQARGISRTENWGRQPHSKFYSNEGTYRKIILAPAVLPSAQKKETSVEPISLCPYHIAGQLGVQSVSGSAIKCISERCKNKHEKIDKLIRNEVTRAIKSIAVKRIRELSEAAVAKHYKN